MQEVVTERQYHMFLWWHHIPHIFSEQTFYQQYLYVKRSLMCEIHFKLNKYTLQWSRKIIIYVSTLQLVDWLGYFYQKSACSKMCIIITSLQKKYEIVSLNRVPYNCTLRSWVNPKIVVFSDFFLLTGGGAEKQKYFQIPTKS